LDAEALIVATMVIVIFVRVETWPARTARESTAELERLGRICARLSSTSQNCSRASHQ